MACQAVEGAAAILEGSLAMVENKVAWAEPVALVVLAQAQVQKEFDRRGPQMCLRSNRHL